MNPMAKSAFITTALFCSIVMLSSCSKKSVIPPEGSPADGTAMSGGTNIDYPAADQYAETGLAGEEPINSTGSGGLSFNDGSDQQSEEYRRTYGRSSTVFSPIYFDFDQAGINTKMAPILNANANYMKDNPGIIIVIEGNSDERGTNEYNLALAERRAINAKEYMVNLGVNPARIRTVSYGEERQLFLGQNEQDWAQNRRADFIVE
ncbi:outer membrane protein/peptidoglycan-associated (lipo)protein [Desulfocapsa sulfexigens DSM 10523]|uniref:Peptidoglycan-associated lipoprotein n=1 Tax=Desulfocapsa sulfexigens (strain DSM 10523 / SB164P1) TaxID=1167006 RepID=M1PMH6_DESSD|nr:OmpA family protein [Desulfocapsa sulfexigens]AGF77646.1 outer membrane protein/peptidoglycan-associated (lipo)protein [Desulfocapsa sulfexigens DSM 10523]